MLSDAEIGALTGLAAAVAARDPAALDEAADRAARDAEPERVEEVLLQSYLFVGFPVALEAVGVWRKRSGRTAPGDVDAEDPVAWRARGETVCATVYGGQYDRLRANIAELHPQYERWMVVEGYGKVLGRPGLGLAVRELCIAAQLAALGAPRQLYSHLRGARHAGATEEQIGAALAEAAAVSGEGRAREAAEVWESVRRRNSDES